MTEPFGTPAPDPRKGRQRYLVTYLRASLVVVVVLALVALVVPDESTPGVATAALVVLITAPLVRVGWLAVRWFGVGDRRYAGVALTLLAVAGAALLV